MANDKLTPLMEQYYRIKKDYPDKILFFRMGDFYEMFGEDAEEAAPILEIALTSRAHGKAAPKVPLAGIPYHALEKYLGRLIEAGKKVVICEQTEDPKLAKGLVKREVVEVITPGTYTSGADNGNRFNYLAAVVNTGNSYGLSYLELSTGDFYLDDVAGDDLIDRLRTLDPKEIVIDDADGHLKSKIKLYLPAAAVSKLDSWKFDRQTAHQKLVDHFKVDNLEGFGIDNGNAGICSAGGILYYLDENKLIDLKHIRAVRIPHFEENMFLDSSTLENLEIFSSPSGKSLFTILNRTRTSMGARRLRQALQAPLRNLQKIKTRQQNLTRLVEDRQLLKDMSELMKSISDLERISGRLGRAKAGPRDIYTLQVSLEATAKLRELTKALDFPEYAITEEDMVELERIAEQISAAIVDEPPFGYHEGGIFKAGYDQALDDLKESISESQRWIAGLQAEEKGRTGIPSLKVGFNKVFGYYIEVTRPHLEKVPPNYIRKQTLVSAERFITEELKQKEEIILSAEEKINRLEENLFLQLCEELSLKIELIQKAAHFVAEADLSASLASCAISFNYIRPELNNGDRIKIINGRHPVIEQILPSGKFVPNDTEVDTKKSQMHIITGPNMAGKSTYLRQVGQIVLLAQTGSYIPAESAEIGLVDRIFTRVGATDKITLGQSTFLVEMNETANILHNCTEKSLILLDEIGRGTSTYDGLSIAWAVSEYLHETDGKQAKTLFATHYHELTRLANRFKRIKNFQVAVKEWQDQIIFIRKIVPGGCDDSYGIFVAQLAGVPKEVTDRARTILRLLEGGKFLSDIKSDSEKESASLFEHKYGKTNHHYEKIIEKLKSLNPEQTTPLEALNILVKLKEMIGDDD
ncbi:MAG TPA: DNA mismatch repair protein MutS [candidate division Zixibacteria bacterium]|nr:DNA mismatch repair protein MutS [candidate division Zixibacteria bacterium]